MIFPKRKKKILEKHASNITIKIEEKKDNSFNFYTSLTMVIKQNLLLDFF
jgi:hypothetical protein